MCTTGWFKDLGRSERKTLLDMLHEYRSGGMKNRTESLQKLFLSLLHHLEDDHEEAKHPVAVTAWARLLEED